MINAWNVMSTKEHHFTYEAALAAAEKINWHVDDVIGGDKRLDFSKRFMPEALARVEPLTFLSDDERRTLNQIRANGYLCLFGILEEFILPFVLDHARTRLGGEGARTRALLQFASEEAKHIDLFKRFRDEFECGFGSPCPVIGPADAIGRAILAHDPLAVALIILQGEWMTQRHYVESVKDDGELDPQFKSLLRHHWMEEAQHAKLDTLMVEALVKRYTMRQLLSAVDEYFEIIRFLDGGLMQQVELDVASFELATGRQLTDSERESLVEVQRQATRWTFLGSGMTHRTFLATIGRMSPSARARVEQYAPVYS